MSNNGTERWMQVTFFLYLIGLKYNESNRLLELNDSERQEKYRKLLRWRLILKRYVKRCINMSDKKFAGVGAFEGNPKWEQLIKRKKELYKRPHDTRSEFNRDYNRILHSNSFRRLKHKTQVFFATQNDHICTRIEHVNHVASVSYTIADCLGLNTELTNAIAIGHDIGHAPFGHAGEEILRKIITDEKTGSMFWHERNSLHFVDDIETIPDDEGKESNLDLTYAVRDGIICHCGEVDEEALKPRQAAIDLCTIEQPSQYKPYTWEGCVVKVADKISYLGRDIEDAETLGILSDKEINKLKKIIKNTVNVEVNQINNGELMHGFIIDLCRTSSPDTGIRFSPQYYELLQKIRKFNGDYIYRHPRLETYKKYAELVLTSIFQVLKEMYAEENTLDKINNYEHIYPTLVRVFREWVLKYFDVREDESVRKDYNNIIERFSNNVIYSIKSKNDYNKGLIDFISGFTDSFAIRVFNEIITFS